MLPLSEWSVLKAAGEGQHSGEEANEVKALSPAHSVPPSGGPHPALVCANVVLACAVATVAWKIWQDKKRMEEVRARRARTIATIKMAAAAWAAAALAVGFYSLYWRRRRRWPLRQRPVNPLAASKETTRTTLPVRGLGGDGSRWADRWVPEGPRYQGAAAEDFLRAKGEHRWLYLLLGFCCAVFLVRRCIRLHR